MTCPFAGVRGHDGGGGGPEVDEPDALPIPFPLPLPLPVPVVPAKREKEEVVTDIAIFERELEEIVRREVPHGPGGCLLITCGFDLEEFRKKLEIHVPFVKQPATAQEVVATMREALRDFPAGPPGPTAVKRLPTEARVNAPKPRGTMAPRPSPIEHLRDLPFEVAEEAAARFSEEAASDAFINATPRQKPLTTAQKLQSAKARPDALRQEAARQTGKAPVGSGRSPAPRGGGGGGFTMRSIVDQILGRVKGRRFLPAVGQNISGFDRNRTGL